MLTNEIRDLIYSYIPIKLNQNTTIVAQATSQSSEEFQTYANIMLNAGVDPNSPYSAISFDTLMLAALALQHQAHNNIKKEDNFRTTRFKKDLIRFDLKSFHAMRNSEKLYKGHYAMLNNKQLTLAIDSLQLKHNETKQLFKKNILRKYKQEINLDTNYQTNFFQTNNKKDFIGDISIIDFILNFKN